MNQHPINFELDDFMQKLWSAIPLYQNKPTAKSASSVGKLCDVDETVADHNSSGVMQEVMKSLHNSSDVMQEVMKSLHNSSDVMQEVIESMHN